MKIKTEKRFDAVKMMREIRDKISKKTGDMDFKEFKKYMDRERLNNKSSTSGKKER